MSTSDFEWQTDDDEVKMGLPTTEAGAQTVWPWRLLLLVMLGVTAVIIAFRWRTAQQIEAITADVQISHTLVQQAEAAQDVEMLNLVLSSWQPDWQVAQQQLLADGNFASRPAFALQALPEAVAQPNWQLSPDLQEAIALSPRRFVGAEGEEVVLQQTAVYRQGTRNWLLAPPEEAFWGATLITHTRYLSVTYPQRDQVWVERLAADLDALFADELCVGLLRCDLLAVDLHFSTSPQSLLNVTEPLTLLGMGQPLLVPTPTIVGLPLDEAGYMALFKGYGAQVVTAVAAQLLNYDCCRHTLITHALLSKQVSELGLRLWPLDAAAYSHLLNHTFGLIPPPDLLLAEDMSLAVARQQAYALVDFLVSETNLQPMQLATALSAGEGGLLDLPQFVADEAFMARWLDFVYEQSGNGRSTPTAPPPSAIRAACGGPMGATLYQYNLAGQRWLAVHQVPPAYMGDTEIWSLPVGNGFMVREEIYRRTELETRLTIYHLGQGHILLQQILTELHPLPQFGFLAEMDGNGRYLTLFANSRSHRTPSRYFLLDLSSCTAAGCPTTAVAGRPIWSPNGRLSLLESWSSATAENEWLRELQLGDGAGQAMASIGLGYAPAWLDDARYGYLRFNEAGYSEWVVGVVGGDVAEVQLEVAALLTAVPPAQRPSLLQLKEVVIATPEQRAIWATDLQGLDYIFLWDGLAEPQLVLIDALTDVDFSPNGRWLTLRATDGSITLLDTSNGQQQALFSQAAPSWSSNSQWLLTNRHNYLLITNPESGYQQFIANDGASCHQLSWHE